MSTAQILDELPKLNAADRWAILQKLAELETEEEVSPNAEMKAAIDAGLQSAATEPFSSVEELRGKKR